MKGALPGLFLLLLLGPAACGKTEWNDPYPTRESGRNILYSAFEERPKHLDPAQSYSSNEIVFTGQIYEPPLQYHYLKRPYVLIPLTAREIPKPTYYDKDGNPLTDNADPVQVARSEYRITIRPGIFYQPHPAFAKDKEGRPRYIPMPRGLIDRIDKLSDFPQSGTRELTAADYVYQIKRLAHPHLHSPIFGLMASYIEGLGPFAKMLAEEAAKNPPGHYLDLNRFDLPGAQVVDRYTYRIRILGKYPQFIYWLAMPFFAPVPEEVERFYAQPGMAERNLSLDWYPSGTGPYMLTVNEPNRMMVLARNPNFRGESYPLEGEAGDREAGLLADAGKPMPFIEKAVFSLEKENIPYWSKFLQGYYDASGISSDSFDQAVQLGNSGEPELTTDMKEKGIRLVTSVSTSSSYMGFNMLDPVAGGYSERARKLRQAISVAVDYEEYISIFMNGRGIPAQGPIPPGIFGYIEGEAGINPVMYLWKRGQPVRRGIEAARKLMIEAGYPGGRDAQTGKPLTLYFDTMARGPDDKSRLDWMRKQFAKLGIQLVIRATDYNRFQDKMLKGNAQIFEWGWNADYPDPENFLFLLYGPNKKVGKNGENAANYDNPEFNRLFEEMKNMDNGTKRQAVIDRMMVIVRNDAPWAFGVHPKNYSLDHSWLKNVKPNLMANNELKYRRVDGRAREIKRAEWNRPVLWPLALMIVFSLASLVPAYTAWRKHEEARAA
jgi:peptide/nickel transport system substrate-binding protein